MTEKAQKQQVSVTIDAALATWLEEEADKRAVGKAYLVERALRNLRMDLPPVPASS